MAANKWDDYAEGWDANEDVRLYSERAFEGLLKILVGQDFGLSSSRVLDFGCGTGLLTEKLSPLAAQVVAMDSSAKMIDALLAKVDKNNLMNVIAHTGALGSSAERSQSGRVRSFDLVVASSVCSFLPDYERAVQEIAALLKPGGVFVQWDWLEDMSPDAIAAAHATAGLTTLDISEAFAMDGEDGESHDVVQGAARKI